MSALGRQRRGCTPDAELWMRHPCIIHPLSGRDLASRSWEPVTTFPLFTEAKRGIKSKWWIKARLHVFSTGNRTNTVHALPKRNEASTLTDGRGVNGQPAWNRWVWNAEMKSPKIYHAMLRSFLCPFKCKRDWKGGHREGGRDGRLPSDFRECPGFCHKPTDTNRINVGKINCLKAEREKQSFLLLPP